MPIIYESDCNRSLCVARGCALSVLVKITKYGVCVAPLSTHYTDNPDPHRPPATRSLSVSQCTYTPFISWQQWHLQASQHHMISMESLICKHLGLDTSTLPSHDLYLSKNWPGIESTLKQVSHSHVNLPSLSCSPSGLLSPSSSLFHFWNAFSPCITSPCEHTYF